MKILKKIALFIFIGVVFATCKKETLTPSSTVGQPVFSFSGTIGTNSLNMQAGVNNYYMYSSYSQSDSGVYSFIGNLQNTGTINNSIQIIINDNTKTSPARLSNINASLTPSAYYYNIPGGNPIWDSVTFKPLLYGGSPTKYTYTFGDSTIPNIKMDASPVSHLYKTLKNYTTSLAVVSSNGTPKMLKSFNLMKQATANPLLIDSIGCTLLSDSALHHKDSLTAHISGGAAPYGYAWFFGDGSSTTSATPGIVHTYNERGQVYTYTCVVGDYSPTVSLDTLISTLYDSVPQKFRINYTISIKGAPNPNSLSNVTVNYTDPNGNQYTSNNSQQPGSSTFQVTSVSNYQNNTKNQQTKMLTVTFNCMLYPVVSNSGLIPIAATNCKATIAVAYQ
jgi:hypothetical protein